MPQAIEITRAGPRPPPKYYRLLSNLGCPIRIAKILTDRAIEGAIGSSPMARGKEFTDQLFTSRARAPSGEHEFDQLCAELGIEHRLTPPQHPQNNGMVERFNGRIEEVLQSHHFHSGEEMETTLHRYVLLYNQQLPQSALGSKTPLQVMKDWHKLKPELFKKQPYYLTEGLSLWLRSLQHLDVSSDRRGCANSGLEGGMWLGSVLQRRRQASAGLIRRDARQCRDRWPARDRHRSREAGRMPSADGAGGSSGRRTRRGSVGCASGESRGTRPSPTA